MRKLTFLLVWLFLSIPCTAKVVYVDGDASGANNGMSWADAYNYLQDALMMASAGDEIRVAEGTYKTDEFVLSDRPNFGRAETFQLKNGLAIKGGYAGFGEPDPDARDIRNYETILSGDIGIAGDTSDNSYHVVTAVGVDANAVLDGFTITGGQANGGTYEQKYGAGMYNQDASPTVTDCTFSGNSAVERGGGMYIFYGSSRPTLSHCTFTFNQAVIGGGIMSYGAPMLTKCTFFENVATLGGGMWSDGGELSRCVFGGNRSEFKGGGIFMSNNTSLTSCMLSGNISDNGGAVFAEDCDITVTGCTITGNRANYVGGIINDEGRTFVSNCILWNNIDADGEDESAQIDTAYPPSVNYCCIQGWTGGLGGTGNVGVNPAFVQPGHWDTTGAWIDGDYHLLSGSPCINMGDPGYIAWPGETDLDGKGRVLCGRIDMGAYEFHCPKVIYVDADAAGNNDGSSWTDAYNLLQDGLASACEGDDVLVAQGVYKPDQGGGNTSGDREATFQMKNDVTIKGGYAGYGEPDPDAWDVDLYETVLSGDLAGNDVGDLLDVSRAENSYHVVTGSGTDASAVLDGFTITAGNAYNDRCSSYDNGGGIYNENGSPTIANCTFTRNTASDQCGGGGAGMYNKYSNPMVISCEFVGNEYIIANDDGGGGMCNNRSNPTVIDCSFKDNKSNGYGGGMLNYRSNPTLTNCIFINNSSAYRGGGMENRNSSPALTYCAFISNSSYYEGGGMRNESWSSPVLIGCAFTGNSVAYAHSHGGGISNHYEDSPTLINCLFTGNSAQRGGGMYSYWGTGFLVNCTFSGNSAAERGGAMYYRNVNSTLTNCIVWGNTALQGAEIYFEHFEQPSTMTVSYCDIKGGQAGIYVEAGNILNWGDGNIDSEPQFADIGNGNYRLSAGSPCVDAGDNNSVPADVCDLDGNVRIYDGDGDGKPVVDMGAYELGLPPIEVSMKLVPQALNPGSQGKWIKAHFVLPEGYAIEDVDTSRPAEIEQFHIMSASMEVSVKDGLVAVVAAFDRSAFCGIGPFEGEVVVDGFLTSGRKFRGTDTIKILKDKLKQLGVLASNWLSACGAPDWCNGADLDQDAVVNFVDFTLMDGCCFEVVKD